MALFCVYMLVKVKKIWLGHVSVRDYVVKKVLDKKEDLIIEFSGMRKTYPYRSLKTYLSNTNREIFKSKYDGQKYSLIDFPWEASRL